MVIEIEFGKMLKYCNVIRVLAPTQMMMMHHRQQKAHTMEVQLNGCDVAAKITWARDLMDKQIPIDQVFEQNEMIDVIGVTKGHGFKGDTVVGMVRNCLERRTRVCAAKD